MSGTVTSSSNVAPREQPVVSTVGNGVDVGVADGAMYAVGGPGVAVAVGVGVPVGLGVTEGRTPACRSVLTTAP